MGVRILVPEAAADHVAFSVLGEPACWPRAPFCGRTSARGRSASRRRTGVRGAIRDPLLTEVGILQSRRDGYYVLHSLVDHPIATLSSNLLAFLEASPVSE
jgi:hypothetical protein